MLVIESFFLCVLLYVFMERFSIFVIVSKGVSDVGGFVRGKVRCR